MLRKTLKKSFVLSRHIFQLTLQVYSVITSKDLYNAIELCKLKSQGRALEFSLRRNVRMGKRNNEMLIRTNIILYKEYYS